MHVGAQPLQGRACVERLDYGRLFLVAVISFSALAKLLSLKSRGTVRGRHFLPQ